MKTLNSIVYSLALGSLLIACQAKEKKTTTSTTPQTEVVKEETEVQKIESAHQKAQFLSKKAIQFDIDIQFGNQKFLEGKMTLLTNSSEALIEMKDGNKIIVNKDKVYHSPALGDNPMTRFHAYTWSYFFLFPYKLSDEGTLWSEFGNESLNDTPYNIQKLTFSNDTGDTPDDWYYVYSNPESHLLSVAAYIVTYGKGKEEAEKEPHAIKFEDFTKIDGIPFANKWTFWGWSKADGLSKQIGTATLKNIHFVEEVDFSYPDNFIEK